MENEVKKERKLKILKHINKLSKKAKIIFLAVTLMVVAGVLLGLLAKNEAGKLTTISESSLQKIVEINELSTVDYTYNATATKYTEDNSKIMYHVAYEGTVTAGIDFQKITFDVNKDEKTVTITLPQVEIHAINVNMGTMDYIFTNDKYETETISSEAYKLCKNDLKNRIEKEELLYKTAKENAVSSVEALFKPWIETIDKEYMVEIV